jgi:hypothetical protein
MDHLLLAAGAPAPRAHVAYLVWGAGRISEARAVPFEALDPHQARAILADLLGDLLGGPHAHLLPIEAVADPRVPDTLSLDDWIQGQLRSGRFQCLQGPVTHPATYPAAGPGVLEARRIRLETFLRALGRRG